jgi:hypothetical protein
MTEVVAKDSRCSSRRRNSQPPENPVYVKFEHIKDFDCLFGKGKNRMHIGNVAFRALIRSRVDHYQNAPSRGYRVRIIIDALDSIHEGGGRMLRLHDEAQKIWLVMDRESARDKVGDSIRDIIKTRKRRKIPEAPRNDIVSSLDEKASFAYIMDLLTSGIDKRLKRRPSKKKKRAAAGAHVEGDARAAAAAKPAAGSLPSSPTTGKAGPGAAGAAPTGKKLKPTKAVKGPPEEQLSQVKQANGVPGSSSVGAARSQTALEEVRSSASNKSKKAGQPAATEMIIPVGPPPGQVDHAQASYQRDLHNARSRYQIDRALTDMVGLHAASLEEGNAFLSRLQQSGHGGPTQHKEALRDAALRRSGLQQPRDHEQNVSESTKRLAAALEIQRIAQGEIERETRLLSEARAGSSAAAENVKGLAIRDLLLNQQSGHNGMLEAHHHRQDIQALLQAEQERRTQGARTSYDPVRAFLLGRAQASRGLGLPPGGIGMHEREDQWMAARAAASLDRDRDLISQLTGRGNPNLEDLLTKARAFDSGSGHAGLSLPPQHSFRGAGAPISRGQAEQQLSRQRHAALSQIERGRMTEQHQKLSLTPQRRGASSQAASDYRLGSEFVDPLVATALGMRPSDQDVLAALAARRRIRMESEGVKEANKK